MKFRIAFFLIAGTFLLSISSAYGFQATFTPRISVGEEYTDNYFLTADDKTDEFITTISPGFSAQILGKTNGAEIAYDPEYALYDTYSENNVWRHAFQFRGWLEPTKNTRFDLSNNFYRTEDPLTDADLAAIRTEDPAAPVDSTIRKGRNLYSRNSTNLNMSYQFGQSDSLDLGYDYYFLENDDPDIEDSRRHNPYIELTYWFFPQWGLNARGSYAKGEFDVSDDLDAWRGTLRFIRRFNRNLEGYISYLQTAINYEGEETEDDKTYNPSVGINYSVAEDTSLALDIGYFSNVYEYRDDQTGLTLDGRLIKRFRRASINVSVLGGYDYSLFNAENLGFEKFAETGVSATYLFTRYVSANAFGSYRYSKYVDEDPEREDDTARAGLGLTVQPLEWMSIGLNYTFRLLDSTIDSNDYEENRGLLRITLSPSTPWRTN